MTVYVNRHAPAAVTGVRRRLQLDARRRRHALGPLRRARPTGLPRRPARRQQADLPGQRQRTGAVTCTDSNPIASSYALYAGSTARTSPPPTACTGSAQPRACSIALTSGTAPDAPTGLTASVVDGKPTLSWTAPATVPNGPIRFYRIYRDTGTNVSDRYDETVTNSPNYVDPKPGTTTNHRYWVTAVDQDFNESARPPVDAPPVVP